MSDAPSAVFPRELDPINENAPNGDARISQGNVKDYFTLTLAARVRTFGYQDQYFREGHFQWKVQFTTTGATVELPKLKDWQTQLQPYQMDLNYPPGNLAGIFPYTTWEEEATP